MTVRNIRAHQSRGLLPPPEVRGRTGYYGPEHVARLELIHELQAEGFNLEAIRRLLERHRRARRSEVLRFTRALRAPFDDEEPEVIDARRARRALRRRPATPSCSRARREARPPAPARRRRYEVPSPRAAARRRGARRARRRRSSTRSTVVEQLRRSTPRRRARLRRAVPRGRLEAVRRGRRGPRSAGPRSARRSSACARWPPRRCSAVFQRAMTDAVEKAFGEEIASAPRARLRERGSTALTRAMSRMLRCLGIRRNVRRS